MKEIEALIKQVKLVLLSIEVSSGTDLEVERASKRITKHTLETLLRTLEDIQK